MDCSYKLSAIIGGHTNDVRCLSAFGTNCFASGSRDATARVWTEESGVPGNAWTLRKLLRGHPNYVSSVCFRHPDGAHPNGLVYTGCNDGKIRVFDPVDAETDPFQILEAHSACVSSLFMSSSNTMISTSWDTTAKVWLEGMAVITMEGHTAAVWAATLLKNLGVMVTGSADATIKLWQGGICKETLKSHTQAVRGLSTPISEEDRFISCGNDGQILLWRVWNVDGGLGADVVFRLQHADFVYGLCSSPTTGGWVSCGENTSIKVFDKDGGLQQEMAVPAISVWAVVVLSNGDIVAGCSDNKIYVFTQHDSRAASSELVALFNSELDIFKRSKSGANLPDEIGGVKTSEIPGVDALNQQGNRDGQTKMIRSGDTVSVHSWSSADQTWTKIGDVVGEPGNNHVGGKVTFEGKEYDHVFHIDVEDGVILKLPYNVDEEPYVVAQNFIHRHNLPQSYLDQVASFIIKNSKRGSKSSPSVASANPWADPDPGSTEYFPQKTYLHFSKVPNMDGLAKKLHEFNEQVPPSAKLLDSQLKQVLDLPTVAGTMAPAIAALLMKILGWPKTIQFNPGLDLARLLLLKFHDALSLDLADTTLAFVADASNVTNQMLALKVLTNMFASPRGQELMKDYSQVILHQISALLPTDNKTAQVAVSTLVLNYSILSVKSDSKEIQERCVTLTSLLLDGLTDPEAKFRTLVALGTLINDSSENRTSASSLDLKERVRTCKITVDVKKVIQVAESLLKLF